MSNVFLKKNKLPEVGEIIHLYILNLCHKQILL